MKKLTLEGLTALTPDDLRITFPTWLTLIRLVLIPCIVVSMLMERWDLAFGIFTVTWITDILDGFLARQFNCQTFLGACLDPIADKLLILSVFFTLVFIQPGHFAIPLWFVLLVLIKELLLIGGAAVIFLVSGSLEVKPTWLGKATMVAQTSFIIWLFTCAYFNWVPVKTYYVVLGALLTLVLLSLLQYTTIGLSYLGRRSS